MEDTIIGLIQTYHELNSPFVDILTSSPSALEFSRYVGKNRPFLVRGGCAEWYACCNWNANYLENVMRDQNVTVAITPRGNADSVIDSTTGDHQVFVKPWQRDEEFTHFLHQLQQQERGESTMQNVKYAQTQNDNLRGEYEKLFRDVEQDIPWARIALNQRPEAINLWIGNSRSATALHKDNYENIYCQILGSKEFILLSPVEAACVNEQVVPVATYTPVSTKDKQTIDSGLVELVPVLDVPHETIPTATFDPDKPQENGNQFSHVSRPLRAKLNPGDMLYLPSMWYHKVTQSCGEEGICCAVNYWYDMSMDGQAWSTNNFIREVALKFSANSSPN